MNTRAKGNRIENKAVKILEASGYLTHRAGYKRFKDNDIFGLWDILAVSKYSTMPFLIQVKSNKISAKDKRRLIEFRKTIGTFRCEIWIWQDRKGFKVIEL